MLNANSRFLFRFNIACIPLCRRFRPISSTKARFRMASLQVRYSLRALKWDSVTWDFFGHEPSLVYGHFLFLCLCEWTHIWNELDFIFVVSLSNSEFNSIWCVKVEKFLIVRLCTRLVDDAAYISNNISYSLLLLNKLSSDRWKNENRPDLLLALSRQADVLLQDFRARGNRKLRHLLLEQVITTL